MAIQWTSNYSIGIDKIDEQHQELFTRFDALLTACQQGQGNKEVYKLFKFLDEYVVKHFEAEEKLQREISFPDYERHRLEHEKFKHQLKDLESQFSLENRGVYLVIATNKVLVEWLIEHISKMDKAIASHLKGKQL